MRTRLLDAKDNTQCNIAATLNVHPDDPRFTQILNRVQRRLILTGEMFWGLFGRYAFCADNSCITWPRQIASIESAAVCDHPIPIRNGWFEFLDSGPGLAEGCGHSGLLDRGTACTIVDIIGINKKIKVYADVSESATAKITLQGYDENGNWIRTQVAGVWIDGEQVALNSATPQTSTKFFTSLVSVQKSETNGTIRLYEYDTTLATQRTIAIYEPDETNPAYRRSYISGLSNGCCSDTDEGCDESKVTVMAKLEFIPAKRDADWLLIGNLDALELGCMALMKEQNNLFGEAAIYMNGGRIGGTYFKGAVGILRDEYRHYAGSGNVVPIKMQPRSVGGAGVRSMV